MDAHGFLELILILLISGLIFVPIAKRAGFGSVLGYLVGGVIIGPQLLGLIDDPHSILQFSEFGVVMLLFIIGLELKPSALWKMKAQLLAAGGLQVSLSFLLLFSLCLFFGFSVTTSVIISFAFSLSSTAFVLQLLSERKQLATPEGQNSFLVLLFQDLAVIPFLAGLPLMAESSDVFSAAHLISFSKAVGAILLVIVLGLFILPRFLKFMASVDLREMLTACALFLVFGLAFLMESVGLSMELGAFLGGMLLAGSEYRHELEANIESFKGLLMGFFFIAIGMQIDFLVLFNQADQVFGFVAVLMAVKFLVLVGVARFCGLDRKSQFRMAGFLSQAGEFAFVILAVAFDLELLAGEEIKLLSIVVALSMAFTPVLILLLERFFIPRIKPASRANVSSVIPEDDHLVVVAGFGRVGQIVSRILRLQGIKFTALEKNPAHIDFVKKWGNKVFYGDASRLDLLKSAHLDRSKVFVNAIDDPTENIKACELVLQHFPQVKIIARARNRFHEIRLRELGVEQVFRETLDSSVLMGEKCLIACGLSYSAAASTVNSWVSIDQKILAGQMKLTHDEELLVDFTRKSAESLESMFQQEAGEDAPQETAAAQ